MSRRLRLTLIACGSIVLAGLLALVVMVYLLLQPDRFTAMLQTQASNVGLELNLARPASPTLFPRPALELYGITLNAQGANVPILLAARGRLALPWRTLLGGPTVISQLEIEAPRVDLDALQAWLAKLPPRPSGRPPDIPRIDAGVSISRGSIVRGNELLLSQVALQTGSLVSGQPFPITLSALTTAGTPLQLRLSATPRIDGSTLQLDNVALHLAQASTLALTLDGSVRWHEATDTRVSLAGKLDYAGAGQYTVSLLLNPASADQPRLLALRLDGPDNRADLRLPPRALLDWWNGLNSELDPQLSVPPGSGRVEIAKLQAGGVRIKGLSILAGDEVPAAATTIAPASTPTGPAAKQAVPKKPAIKTKP
jgi:AsmA protein